MPIISPRRPTCPTSWVPPTAIGEKVTIVQKLWKDLYHLGDNFLTDGSQWDRLFAEDDEFTVGEIPVRVMFSPGHTLASITYVAGDAAFVHDTLMMPESGTSRARFSRRQRRGPVEFAARHPQPFARDAALYRPRLPRCRHRP